MSAFGGCARAELDFREFSALVREREMAIHSEAALRRRFSELDIDGSGYIDMPEFIKFALRDALQRSAAEVTFLLAQWDSDGNGTVEREEWRAAINHFGFEARDEEIDAIFDELDFNRSGSLELRELKQKLFEAHSARVDPTGKNEPADPRHRLRPTQWRQGTDDAQKLLDATASAAAGVAVKDGTDVRRQLAIMLEKQSARLLDIIRAWDENGDGLIQKSEFRQVRRRPRPG